jgi:hypothetical protein
MNIVWQDTPGSFLDPTVIDAASTSTQFLGGDGSTLWSSTPVGTFGSGDSLLWNDGAGTPASWQANLAAAGLSSPGRQHQFGLSSGSIDIAWTDPSPPGAGLVWQADGWQSQSPFAVAPVAGGTEWTSSLSTPAGILWSSAESTTPPTLGGPRSPFNLPAGGPAQPRLADGLGAGSQSLAALPTSQLLWPSQSASAGALASGGQAQIAANTSTDGVPMTLIGARLPTGTMLPTVVGPFFRD